MKVYSAKDIGSLVRAARKEAHLTQRDLAEECACGVRFLSELENGKPTIELERVIRVLNTLSLDLEVSVRSFE